MNTSNSRILNIAGKNTNETYTVSVPSNLLGFCRYDFTRFMEECNKLCRECMKTGNYPSDKVVALRNSIAGCHRYFENNTRTIFDKIVVDCWIEYICRQGEVSASALWNSFIECENPFQKAIFRRLTEYRSHYAVNQWINLLKLQEYAGKKLDYVFGCKLSGPEEAEVRLNFFDLMFSVAANEQGYDLDTIGSVRMYKPGRLTNAPFVFGGVSKEIVKNLLKDVSFADNLGYTAREEGALSDGEAMDAFGVIKNHLPAHSDPAVKIMMKSIVKAPDTVYIPSGFKAMLDLEIDTVINSGGYLQRCARCKEFFFKNSSYTSDYCDTVNREGISCREIMEGPAAEPLTDEELALFNQKAEQLYNEMLGNMNRNISQRDFNEWIGYFDVIKNNVMNGRGTSADFDDFVEYSRQIVNQKPSKAKQEVIATEEEIRKADGSKKTVRPYQFTRIDRKELEKQGLLKPAEDDEDKHSFTPEEVKAVVPPAPAVSRVIRGAQPAESYQEIPVGQAPQKRETARDVYIGEDFSLDKADKGAENTAADNALKTAEASRADILNIVRADDRSTAAETTVQTVFDTRQKQNDDTATVGEKSPRQENFGQNALPNEKEEAHILPDLEEFPDSTDTDNLNLSDMLNIFDGEEEKDLSELSPHKDTVKHEPPKVKLPEYGKQKDREDFVTLISEKEREESGHIVKSSDEDMALGSDSGAAKAAKPAKRRTEMNRAARVAGAYRSVLAMEKEDDKDSAADDFAKILSSIERNDGFDDEELPVDPDGVPLSHKTKHVMDAIMKNSSVSPSLTYGRRQAAEKNVIIDEDYVEKNGKKKA